MEGGTHMYGSYLWEQGQDSERMGSMHSVVSTEQGELVWLKLSTAQKCNWPLGSQCPGHRWCSRPLADSWTLWYADGRSIQSWGWVSSALSLMASLKIQKREAPLGEETGLIHRILSSPPGCQVQLCSSLFHIKILSLHLRWSLKLKFLWLKG